MLKTGCGEFSHSLFIYMSLYDRTQDSSLKIKRRLFDSSIEKLGRTIKIVRIQYQEDIYKDLTDIEALSHNEISAVIKMSEDIPLDRYRLDGTDHVEDTRTYFFDLIPIEVYTKISDSLEVRDLLFFWLTDENNNKIPMLLQITESFGRFTSGLIWKKSYAAPVYGALTKPLYTLLKDYYTPEKFANLTEEPLLREDPRESEDPHMVRESRTNDIMGG